MKLFQLPGPHSPSIRDVPHGIRGASLVHNSAHGESSSVEDIHANPNRQIIFNSHHDEPEMTRRDVE